MVWVRWSAPFVALVLILIYRKRTVNHCIDEKSVDQHSVTRVQDLKRDLPPMNRQTQNFHDLAGN